MRPPFSLTNRSALAPIWLRKGWEAKSNCFTDYIRTIGSFGNGGNDPDSTPDSDSDIPEVPDDLDESIIDIPAEDVPLTDIPDTDVPLMDISMKEIPLSDIP